MKKIALVLFMLVFLALPTLTSSKAQPVKTKAILAASTFTFYQSYNFGAKQNYDYLGSFSYGGVYYDLYGSYPDVLEVTSSVGTVYAAAGEYYLAPPDNVTSADVYINDSTNGIFHYNGPVWF